MQNRTRYDQPIEATAGSTRTTYRMSPFPIAKEKLYKLIHQRACGMKPHFNIGITTGGGQASRWELRYGHWKFVPKKHEYEGAKTKCGRNKKPT